MGRSKQVSKVLLLALAVCLYPQAIRAADYESPPVLEAKDFLPSDRLKGEHYEVEPRVTSDGYMNRYTIRSDFGTFEARSTAMALKRISEVGGIARLKELSQTDAFAGALAESAEKTVQSVGRVVEDPVGTAKGVSAGVGRMVKRMALKAEKAVDKAGEVISKEGGEEGATSGDSVDKAVEAGKDIAGVNSAKRRLARRAGVDPYSGNEVLQAELDRLAWAAFGGGFAVDKATSGIPLQGELASVSNMVWESSPADLEVMGREKLAKMGTPKDQIDAFYKARALTTSSRAAIVTILDKMEGVENRPEVARLASRLEGEDEALFYVASCAMLQGYHSNQKALEGILAGPVMPWGVRGDGTLVLALALDYLSWTEDIAAAAARIDGDVKKDSSLGKVEIWVSGSLSPRSRTELESLGWEVHVRAAGEMGIERPR